VWLKDGDCDPRSLIEHLRRREEPRPVTNKPPNNTAHSAGIWAEGGGIASTNLDRWDYGSGQSGAAFFGIESDR